MKKIIKKIKEKIKQNVFLQATMILGILMFINIIFEFLQKLKK